VKNSRERLDILLVRKGFFDSRSKARAVIGAGLVLVDNRPADKAGHRFDINADIKIRGDNCPYCSRGGLKLEKALKEFKIDVNGLVCLDAGASTGGFTDCLLQHGACRVYAVDVGYGQLDWKLRKDERVVVVERTNIRYLSRKIVPEPVELVTIDTSFISLKLVVPPLLSFLVPDGRIIALVKPQFEVGRKQVGKGGVVRDEKLRNRTVRELGDWFVGELGLEVLGVTTSPVKGAKGNVEFLMMLQVNSGP
jgi:23S rRNA (cytidine1920-2'-O)/16S rRNA (cytidine1409-2'-O)-methyltransferase